MARWHNFIIGGCDSDGKDATNELSYLMLDAALDCQIPHHTLTMRVGKDSPIDFIAKGMEVVRTGAGMPAFISEDSYINFITKQGIPGEEAREFAIAGCMDLMLPGKSRYQAFGMSIIPMYLETALYNGREPKSGELLGLETGEFESFENFEDFYRAFLEQCRHFIGMVVEEHNILLMVQRELYPDVVTSAFLHDAMKVGRDGLDRRLPFENGSAINVIGMANTVDSLAVVKKLVFEDKSIPADTMIKALRANWEGYEDLRKLCLDSPKYGNNDAFVDDLAGRFWHDFGEIVQEYTSIFDAKVLPTAISITAHAPGGAMTSATPDGRKDGETFADGSISPVQGMDRKGPLAALQSAMKLPQDEYMATLLNMKFHPGTLKTDEDLKKLASMVKIYLVSGGKQIQLNIISRETLEAAKIEKDKYRDLIIRVAGYSTYYVTLTSRVQDEIIARTEQAI